VNVVTGADIGCQAWVGDGSAPARERPAPGMFVPVGASDYPSVKPNWYKGKTGGMWTSTFDARLGSAWIQWCLSEHFCCDRENPTWHTWLLGPEPTARVYVIDDYADLHALVVAYPHGERDWPVRPQVRPAWHRIAEHFDAVHLTAAGQDATRLSHPLDLYGWDCESTLWLRWAFATVEDGGVRTYEPADPWWQDDDAADELVRRTV
jgi:hypothetical protein